MKRTIFTNKNRPRHPATAALDEVARLQTQAEREFAAGNRHRGALLVGMARAKLDNFKTRTEPGAKSIWTA